MKGLKEFRDKVAENVKKSYLNSFLKSKSNKAFWNALSEGNVQNEATLKNKVYWEVPAMNESIYVSAKSRFKNGLLQGLYSPDFNAPMFSPNIIKYYKCNQYLFMGKILFKLGIAQTGIEMLTKSLKAARELNATIEQVNCLMLLCDVYSNRDAAKYRQSLKMLESMMTVLKTEIELKNIFNKIQIDFSGKAGILKDPEIVKEYETLDKKARNLVQGKQNFIILYYYYHIRSMILEALGKFSYAILECDKAISNLDKFGKMFGPIRKSHFYLRKFNCCLTLHRYTKASEAAVMIKKLYPPGSLNYLRARMHLILTPLQNGKFQEAWLEFQELNKTDLNIRSLPEIEKEKWKVISGYIALGLLYLKFNDIKLTEQMDKFLRKQAPDKLLSDCPNLIKDKTGWNVNILILQIMFKILTNDHPGLIDKYDAIRIYIRRYFDENTSEQTLIFLNFLKTSINISDRKVFNTEYQKTMIALNKIQPVKRDKEAIQELIHPQYLLKMYLSLRL